MNKLKKNIRLYWNLVISVSSLAVLPRQQKNEPVETENCVPTILKQFLVDSLQPNRFKNNSLIQKPTAFLLLKRII